MFDGRAPIAPIDVTTAAFSLDPASGYDELRLKTPISWLPAARGFVLSRYADVAQAYRDPFLAEMPLFDSWRVISRKLGRDYTPALRLFEHMPFIHEGTRHRQLRTAIARALAPVAGANDIFARHVARLLSPATRDGGFDLSEQFASKLGFDIFSELAELPDEEREEVRPLARLSPALDATLSAKHRDAISATIHSCMPKIVARVRKTLERPGASFVHRIEDALPADESDRPTAAAYILAVILVTGNDTLAGCITYAARRFLADSGALLPRQSEWADLSDDAIRFASPVSYSMRIATAETEVGGCPIHPGEMLVISPFAANHDPTAFPDPARVKHRPGMNVGLAFGAGAHVCLGLRMSRNVVRSALQGLAHLPAMRLAGPAKQGPGRVVRTLVSLPVQLQ